MIRAIHFLTPTLDNDRSRNLEEYISHVENRRTESKHAIAQSEIGTHPQTGKRYVDAVNVIDDVENEDERQQTPCRAASSASAHCKLIQPRIRFGFDRSLHYDSFFPGSSLCR